MNFEQNDDTKINLPDIDEELSNIPPREELEKMYQFSRRHNQRMEQLFAEMKKKRKRRNLYRNVRNAAAVAAAVIVITVGIWMANGGTSDIDIAKSPDDTSVTATPGTEEIDWNIQYIPAGFENCSVYDYGAGKELIYKNDSGESITFFYQPVQEISVEPPDRTPPSLQGGFVTRDKEVNGIKYQYVIATDNQINNEITWQQDGYEFMIFSKLEPNVLQDMAVSVEK